MERISFINKLPAEIWENIKYEIRKTFQKYLEVNLLNQIHNVINYIEQSLVRTEISSFSDVEL